ncbi:HK97 family phage prohead protease [Clostridium sp. FP1]|uniref:HK97 family phage prohead protease n=1 Tax=Clostridium sp. FP1 TaxID=2724076 RepID=UPI0013E985A0|nr:HK97 family phage prohead protease [Clostridium sp. FP1]MBZ9635595.1 HK97 family phage prohead protease [Clostridium sp. FP1]
MKNKILPMNWQVKVIDKANRIIEMIGSDESFDRVGDKMLMTGADLSNYKKNPVIIANHNYGYTEKPSVIGRALDVNIVGSKMVFKVQFAETDNGKEWFYLYSNKYMNASSIGFIPKEYKPNDQGGYDFIKWELLELSMVAVPCNPNAVQRAYEDKKISKALFDLINKNESEVESMTSKEVEALISKAVDDKVKGIETKHTDEMALKVKEVEDLNVTIKDLEAQVEAKTGASLSKATMASLVKACEGITGHVKSIAEMCKADNSSPDEDEAKDYTPEEIETLVQANIEKMMKEAK